MFQVINGKKFAGKVFEQNKDYFYGRHGRKTEQEYKQLLIDSKKYFDGIKEGTISLSDKYYIYAPEFYITLGYASDIAVITNNKANGTSALSLFVENLIKVRKVFGKYIFAGEDGRHRFAVAKKYKLDLLVYII